MTENNENFKQKIGDLRSVVEKAAESLKRLEVTGTENDANRSLWIAYSIWNGKEYSDIESALKERGHKSSSGI